MHESTYLFNLKGAIYYKIPLILYGESISCEYGVAQKDIGETYSTKEQIYNTATYHVNKEEHKLEDFLSSIRYTNEEFWSILENFWKRDIF